MSDPTAPPGGDPQQPYGAPPSYGDQPPPQYGSQPPPYYAGQAQSNGVAIAALIVGILSLPAVVTIIFAPILGIVAIILGFIGLGRASQAGGAGRGMAIGGIVTGALGILLTVLLFLGLFVFSATLVEGGGVLEGVEEEFGPVFDQ